MSPRRTSTTGSSTNVGNVGTEGISYDPLTGKYRPTEAYEKLFSLIVTRAPAPIGLG